MIKYLAQYIPNESAITEPLRELLKKDAEWAGDKAVENLKAVLTNKPVLAFFDSSRCFAVRPGRMPDAERKTSCVCNAQIEKEMLAICFATGKFHQFVYGKSAVSVQTDHTPLESILKKPLRKAPPRLHRLMLRLQPYDLDVHYVPGKYMCLADTLSRGYIQGEGNAEMEDELSRVVHSLVLNIPVSANKLSEIRQATEQDPTLMKVRSLIMRGWPKFRKSVPPEVQNLWNMRDELHLAEVGEKVLIPAKLRQQMLRLIHESHMGWSNAKHGLELLCTGLAWQRKLKHEASEEPAS